MAHWVGGDAYVDAMRHIVSVVHTARLNNESIHDLGRQHAFSYLLTPKQRDAIKKVCSENGWPAPFCKGIEIDVSTINHILDSRLEQKGVTADFVADIMLAAYNQFATIYVNKNHGEQAVFLNGIKELKLEGTPYYAVAIIAMDQEKDVVLGKCISSVTAYHANKRKIEGIKSPKVKTKDAGVEKTTRKVPHRGSAPNELWKRRA